MPPIIADTAAITLAADLLKQGRLVAFPTETVYGLGADASNPEAVQRIFAAKGRPNDHPLIVHIANLQQVFDWVEHVPQVATRLAAAFWPGPLAIVLNKQPWVPLAVTGGQSTVALRMPNHRVALALLQAFGGGVAAPSANRFCRISPTQASHVAEELGESVDLILDGGACQVGVESTIVDLSGKQPRLLRPGQISLEAIEIVLGKTLLLPDSTATDIRAPGMMAVHYAPLTATVMCASEHLAAAVLSAQQQNQRVAVLAYSHPQNIADHSMVMPASAVAYAQQLYAALRQLDALQLDKIIVEQPPQTSAWRAINDRLAKAAGRI